MGVSKSRGGPPKMDGENNGKPNEEMDDFGGNTQISACFAKWGVTEGLSCRSYYLHPGKFTAGTPRMEVLKV